MKSKLFKPQPHEVIIPSFTITYTGGGTEFCYKTIDSVPIPYHHCSRCRAPPNEKSLQLPCVLSPSKEKRGQQILLGTLY
ncbi:MAG: hypothetical protein WHV60_02105 [Bacteroidota bacterium]